MIRTRDFFLFIQAVAFLLLAIVVTATSWPHSNSVSAYSKAYFTVAKNTTEYKASLADNLNNKEERLNSLREKIRDGSNIATVDSVLDGSYIEPVATTSEAVTSDNEDKVVKDEKVKLCGNYHTASVPQLDGTLTYTERDNQRLFVASVVSSETIGTTTTQTATEKVVLNLPLRTITSALSSCLNLDVVAVTANGSPIRNDDYKKYSGLSSDNLLGYTIDGYPLYGRNDSIVTDECGGVSIDGSYRYYLSAERESILNCFAGIPVNL